MPQSLRISILLLMVLLSTTVSDDHQRKIAVIGEGVVGCSAALALIERDPSLDITVIYDTPFKDTVSWGPAGLFRVEYLGAKPYGKRSFERYAKLFRELGGDKSGVNLLSGHILSTNLTELVEQDENYGDIVYNFRYLTDHEIKLLIAKQPSDARLHGIHYTAYTTEGRVYVPWMKSQLLKHGVKFVQRRVNTVEDLYPEFDVIVNCAGLNGGKVAGDGDDKNMFPIRGIIFQTNATWHNHFLYKGLQTFTIPTTHAVFIGSVKQAGRSDLKITPDDRRDILGRYFELQPALKDGAILSEWAGLRPGRKGGVRLESTTVKDPKHDGRVIQVVHNYGHGGHGFTYGWGCGEYVADLILGEPNNITSETNFAKDSQQFADH